MKFLYTTKSLVDSGLIKHNIRVILTLKILHRPKFLPRTISSNIDFGINGSISTNTNIIGGGGD